MTAEEIRSEPIRRDGGPCVDDPQLAAAFFLREIAAQLAEINFSLKNLSIETYKSDPYGRVKRED